MESIYLSSEEPRLQLASDSDLLAAVAAELLEENHFLDLKREVAAGKAQNKETARDFAQFAVDGGTLIIGLEEADDESILLSPQPLQGLPERIEQIARANCDPPLAIISRPIPTAADSVSHRPQRIGPSAATAIETRIQSPFTGP